MPENKFPEKSSQKVIDIVGPEESISKIREKEKKTEEFFEPKDQFFEREIIKKGLGPGERIKKLGSLFRRFSGIIFAVLILWVLLIAGLYILPRAEVKIIPKTEALSFSLGVKGEKDPASLSPEQNKIPVEYFFAEKEISQEFQSSGKIQKEEKARGKITVYNSYSSSPQTLVKTTRFISDGGKVFRTLDTVVIPGATIEEGKIIPSSIEIEVMAEESGVEYNIGPSTFSIPGFRGTPKYTSFYGKSQEPMSGGFIGQISAVTQEDLDSALKTLADKAKYEVETELGKAIPSNLVILEDAKETKIQEIEKPKVGEEKQNFKVSVKAISRALVFSEDTVKKLISEKIEKEFNLTGKKALGEKIKIEYSLAKFPDFEKGVLDLNLNIEEKIAWKIEEKTIQENLAGKDEENIRAYLSSHPGILRAEVSLWPFWVKKAPGNPEKIKVSVDYGGRLD